MSTGGSICLFSEYLKAFVKDVPGCLACWNIQLVPIEMKPLSFCTVFEILNAELFLVEVCC